MAQQLVAIDASPTKLRVVLFEATFRKAQLLAAYTLPVAPDTDAGESVWLRLKRLLPAQLDSVILSTDPQAASTRLLSFPFDDVRKVEAALDFELENQIPQALDTVAKSHLVAKKGAGQTQVLALVTPKDGMLRQIEQCAAVNLEPRAMTLPAAVLSELLPEQPTVPTAVLSLGETQAHLAILNPSLVFARTIRAGSQGIDRVLAKKYNLSLEGARTAKEREGHILAADAIATPDTREASEAIVEGLSPLLRQLTATLKSLPPEHVPQKLVITGGLSRLPGLAKYLSSKLGMHVSLLDLGQSLHGVTLRTDMVGPEYANALALGLAVLRRGQAVPLNVRRGSLAYRGDIQVYRGEMMRIGIGIAAVFLLAITGSIVRYTLISSEETELNKSFCKATLKIVGKEICDPTAALSTLKHSGAPGDTVVVPAYTAVELFEMMSKMIGKEVDVTFDDLEIRVTGRQDDPDKITGKGEAASFETIEQVVMALKKHPCVQEADVSKQTKNKNTNRVTFNLSAKISCPIGTNPVAAAEIALSQPSTAMPSPDAPNPESLTPDAVIRAEE